MSKVIRTVRFTGPVVTLGQLERELYLDQPEEAEGGATVDLAGLLSNRVENLGQELETRWQARLQEERKQLAQEAQAQLAEAEARWNQQLEQTHQERYEEGFQAGVAAKEAEAREAVERMSQLHETIEAQRAQVLRDADQLVVDLAAALARRIIGVQVELDSKILVRSMRSALEHLGGQSQLIFKVHPEDLNIAKRFAQRWAEKVSRDTAIRVHPGEQVDRGGCMLEGDEANLDARLETQLETLRQALRDALEKGRVEDGTSQPA